LAPAIYRDLVDPLFTMRMPIIGFGVLFATVCCLVLMRWPDPIILMLGMSASAVTIVRLLVIHGYHRAGGAAQPVSELYRWERRYAALTFVFAAMLAGLNVRMLMVHEPMMLTGTVSLVFTFGAGVVSRTSCRPRLCIASLLIAVLPTALAMLWHATLPDGQSVHGEFFLLLGLLLLAVLAMSLDSVRHLYAAMLEQLVTKQDLAKLARFDALTGLPNRLMLRDVFNAGLRNAQDTGTQIAVQYLDLDGFKAINDRHGHPAGDKMLSDVAARLLSTIRSADVAFRLGGDEFVVVQSGVIHRDEAELLGRRIIKQLSEVYVINDTEMYISASVGISMTASMSSDLDELIACADTALYRSKARGKSQLQFCDTSEDGNPAHRSEYRDDLRGSALLNQ
jgi:diguanylate cyclase (GGDEF)-like protein